MKSELLTVPMPTMFKAKILSRPFGCSAMKVFWSMLTGLRSSRATTWEELNWTPTVDS